MARIDINNESIYYTHTNAQAATAVLFIHGSGGTHKSWPHDLRSVENTDVVLLDLPGHGLSSGSGRQSIKDYAAFIDDFILTLGLSRVILAGHSLGGAIVLTLALERPDWLLGLVLVGTGVRLRVHTDIIEGVRRDYDQTVDLICQWAFGPQASPQLVEGSREAMLKTDPEVTLGDFLACNAFDISTAVNRIDYPALVFSASEDRLTPPKYGLFLKQHLPKSRYHLIENAGHMMAVEKPKTFLDYLTPFLNTLS